MAETTTTTSFPVMRVSRARSATFWIRSGSATDVPPYFCTTTGITAQFGALRRLYRRIGPAEAGYALPST